MTIASLIRAERARQDLTQRELAHRIGATDAAVVRAEGDGECSARILAELMRALGIEPASPLAELLRSTDSVEAAALLESARRRRGTP